MTIRTDGMLPQAAAAFNAMQTWLANQGINVTLADFGGFRTEADTTLILEYRKADYEADVRAGRVNPAVTSIDAYRPIAPYGDSYHDYGAAFDIVPVTPYPTGMTYISILARAGSHAGTLGLTWGGTFHNPDVRHFQLQGTLDDVRAKWLAYQDQIASGQLPADTTDTSGDITSGGDIAGGFTTGAVLAGMALIGALVFVLRRKLGLKL